jgi:uncharacterized membrane protein/gas vesicle protein
MDTKRLTKGMLIGLGAGAVTAYLTDPEFGRIRRAAFAKGAKRILAKAAREGKKSLYDSHNRLAGLAAQWRPHAESDPPSDEVLEQRIRSRIGRVVSHPRKIHVVCDGGTVTLWGMVPQDEISELVRTVEAIPGIKEVLDHLEICPPDEPSSTEHDLLRQARNQVKLNWSPAKRLLVGSAGAALALRGWQRSGILGKALTVIGAGLMVRSAMRNHLRANLAFSESSPGYELRKTIRINAPISDLFDFWTNPENYPKAFSHVAKIERLGENLYRWTMIGPAGIPIGWEGVITRAVSNTLVEWKSLPGSAIGNFGAVHFDPHYDASTRIEVRMFYRPPAGILGKFFAELFGADAQQILTQDLKRLKYLFENGELPHEQIKSINEEEDLLKTATT